MKKQTCEYCGEMEEHKKWCQPPKQDKCEREYGVHSDDCKIGDTMDDRDCDCGAQFEEDTTPQPDKSGEEWVKFKGTYFYQQNKDAAIVFLGEDLTVLEDFISKCVTKAKMSVLEEVREKMPLPRVHDIDPLSKIFDEGFNNCHDQVTSLINNLIEEK